MNANFFKKFVLTSFLFATVGMFLVPINSTQAAGCTPKATNITATPTTVSKEKPSTVLKISLSGLTGCDATTSKIVKVYALTDQGSKKIVDVSLADYSSKFSGKTTYTIEQSVNIFSFAAINDYKSFVVRPGVTIDGKDSLDNAYSVTIKNSTGTKAATAKPAANQNVSTEEKIDETGQSGFVICGNTVDTPCNVAHLFRAFIIIINYLITMAGFVAVLFIVIAGVQMTASQGQEMHKQAIQRLSGAIIGLVLVALAFVLVNSLLAGSLRLGIKNGGLILTSPKAYINESLNNSVTPSTDSNTTAPAN